jgi:hypothetical protein
MEGCIFVRCINCYNVAMFPKRKKLRDHSPMFSIDRNISL